MEKLKKYYKPLVLGLGTSLFAFLFYRFFKVRRAKQLSQAESLPLTKGEATFRKNIIRNLKYTLFLQLNTNQDPVLIDGSPHKNVFQGSVLIEFDMERVEDIFLDFKGNILSMMINSEVVKNFNYRNERIYLPAQFLIKSGNHIQITYANHYSHDSEGMRYYIDSLDESAYIYTQFESFFAHTVFPCFDQPSLKAPIKLLVSAPKDWVVISTMDKKEEISALSAGRNNKIAEINRNVIKMPAITRDFTIHEFNETPAIATYTFAVCAGPFVDILDDDSDGVPINIYCRKNLQYSFDYFSVRTTARSALKWFKENLTRYMPYKKFDFVFVPDFKQVAMENVGCITFDDNFLEPNQTSVENVYFHYIIVHELAHTWFGNYVTPEWWDDLWLNESFATFLSYLCLKQISDVDEHMKEFSGMWLQFAKSKTGAIIRDQYKNTHSIRDVVNDTAHAQTTYDKITYYKGASILKYFYYCVGHELFFKALKNYVNSHPNTNANYDDFKENLTSLTETKNIKSHLDIIEPFLDNKGVIRLDTEIKINNNLIEEYKIKQVRCHHATENIFYNFITDILVIYPAKEVMIYNVNIPAQEIWNIKELEKIEKPLAVVLNAGDWSYFKQSYDEASKLYLIENTHKIKDSTTRLVVARHLSEMIIDCSLSPQQFVEFTINLLSHEKEDLIVTQVLKTAIYVVTKFVYINAQPKLKKKLFELIKVDLFLKHKDIRKSLFNYMIDLFDAHDKYEIANLINFLRRKPAQAQNFLRGDSQFLDFSNISSEFEISYLDEKTKFRLLETIAASEVLSQDDKKVYEEKIKSIQVNTSRSGSRDNSLIDIDEKSTSILTGHSLEVSKIEACRPDIKNKEKLWKKFVNREVRQPNKFYEYEMKGFARKSQYELLKPYFTEYFFEDFPMVKNRFGEDYAVIFFKNLSPSFVIDEEVLGKFKNLNNYINYNEHKLYKLLSKSKIFIY